MNNTKILGTYLKNTLKKPFGSKPPSRLLFGFVFMMRYHCILFFFQAKTNTGKYRKNGKIQRKHLLGSKIPSRLDLWFLFMVCYLCMSFLCRQQTVLENRQYQENIKNNTRTKSPLCSKTTLPAIWREGGFKLRFFFPNIMKYFQ